MSLILGQLVGLWYHSFKQPYHVCNLVLEDWQLAQNLFVAKYVRKREEPVSRHLKVLLLYELKGRLLNACAEHHEAGVVVGFDFLRFCLLGKEVLNCIVSQITEVSVVDVNQSRYSQQKVKIDWLEVIIYGKLLQWEHIKRLYKLFQVSLIAQQFLALLDRSDVLKVFPPRVEILHIDRVDAR